MNENRKKKSKLKTHKTAIHHSSHCGQRPRTNAAANKGKIKIAFIF